MGKKSRFITILITCCICFGSLYTMASAKTEEVREYVKTVGNFEYTYIDYKDGVCIIHISPISDREIERLEIPNRLDGKKVIKLFDDKYEDTYVGDQNIFGIYMSEDDIDVVLFPKEKVRTINKIKHIFLPCYLKEIEKYAFDYVEKGKTIYIPAGLKQNVIEIARTCPWKSIDISPDNKWFRVKNQWLLSKTGEKLYGYFGTKTKVKIPNGVKCIVEDAIYHSKIEEIFIPKSVRKIEKKAFRNSGYTTPLIRLSEKNPYLGLENNCIYNKKTGNLIAAFDENGIITIPKVVTSMKDVDVYGDNKLEKIIIPKTIRKMGEWQGYIPTKNEDNLIIEFLSSTPPKELDFMPDSVISVPRGSKERYDKAILEIGMELRDYWYKDSVIKYENYFTPPDRVVIERPYIPYYKFLDAILCVNELQKHCHI